MIQESKLSELIKQEIKEYDNSRGLRSKVEIDRSVLIGLLTEFDTMYNFIKADDTFNLFDRVRHAIRAFALNNGVRQPNKGFIYKDVLKILIDEIDKL